VFQNNTGNKNSCDLDIQLEGDGALDISENALIIAYLQVGEVLDVRLTPKEHDHVVHRAKQFKWEGNSLLQVWSNAWVWVMFPPKQWEGLYD
jgi:endo-alpha-1,4-polygalactosaminidase (GH114 family)